MNAENDSDVPVHPLFVDEEEHAPLKQKIATIDVSKRAPSGKYVFMAWYDADELADERAVLTIFGPGSYKFDGKDKERSRILRKSFRDLGVVETASPAPAAPPSSSGEDRFLEYMKLENAKRDEERRQEREDRREEREREAQRSRDMMTIVTEFSKASLAAVTSGKAGAPAADPLAMLRNANEVLSEIRLGHEAERQVVREELEAQREAAGAGDSGVMETFIASFGAGVAKKMGVEMVDPTPPKSETH